MKIAFLINNAYGIGGTIRSTVNLSHALATRHEVEVVSVHRVSDAPLLSFDPRVRLTSLIDMREDSAGYEGHHELTRRPCTMFPDTGAAANSTRLPYSALQDDRIGTWLRTTDADVVIATRPDLNGYLARDGQDRCLRIGQEHLSLDAHDPTLRGHQNRALAGLDAFVTVSEADARQYRTALPDVPTRIVCIPNAVPAPGVEPSTRRSKTVVAAGRLMSVKRYDRLVEAFAKATADHPDWTLRLYGRGPEKPRLRELIDGLGLHGRAFLMGPVSPIATEWAKGAIAAVSSDMESFGMTIVEAMHCGVPVVATDCPHGPAEIIEHGRTGLLVPLDGGVDAYAAELSRLMDDAALRDRIGDAARERAKAFSPGSVARRYEQLFRDARLARHKTRELRDDAAPRPALRQRIRTMLEVNGVTTTATSGTKTSGGAATGAGASGAGATGATASTTAASAATTTGAATSVPPAQKRPASEQPTPERPAPERPAPEQPARGAAPAPRPPALAHTLALPDGGVVVRFDAATLPRGPLDFVARLRKDPKGREIRLPVPSVAFTADLTDVHVTLPAHPPLAEGRWDCYVTRRGSTAAADRTRLTATLTEQAALVNRPPAVDADGVSARIPYTTSDGFLALRTWQRLAHAEVDDIVLDATTATVTAELLGADQSVSLRGATVIAISRTSPEFDLTFDVTELPEHRFLFTIRYDAALARRRAEHDLWDLRLHLDSATALPIPVGHIGGDIVDRKRTDTVPARFLPHPERGTTRIKPFFTVGNDLAMSAKDTSD